MAHEEDVLLPDFGENVDLEVFEQILEMDEDAEREFSSGIVLGFLEQAETTFEKMEEALEKKSLPELSALGHFLKGSSATLGFTKVKDECEKIQHYGSKKDESGVHDEPDEDKCLRLTTESLNAAKKDYDVVAKLVRQYYAELAALHE